MCAAPPESTFLARRPELRRWQGALLPGTGSLAGRAGAAGTVEACSPDASTPRRGQPRRAPATQNGARIGSPASTTTSPTTSGRPCSRPGVAAPTVRVTARPYSGTACSPFLAAGGTRSATSCLPAPRATRASTTPRSRVGCAARSSMSARSYSGTRRSCSNYCPLKRKPQWQRSTLRKSDPRESPRASHQASATAASAWPSHSLRSA